MEPTQAAGTTPAGTSGLDTLESTAGATLPVICERYVLEHALGNGGMGKVYRALDRETGLVRAIKVMHNNLSDNIDNVRRFELEARVALGLEHRNILVVTDFGLTDNRQPFIVMEYIEGSSLSAMLEENHRLPVSDFLVIFQQICSGLSYAHEHNVVHRDIKPSNIMLTPEGTSVRVRIVDFGIARVCKTTGEICPTSIGALQSLSRGMDGLSAAEQELLQHLTQPGEIFGSPAYMSPEQCSGQQADCRSDVFSLGCLIFEALTGTLPLKGQNAMATLFRRMNEVAPRLSDVVPGITFAPELERIVARALEPDPELRYQSVSELSAALAEAESSILR